MHHWLTGYYLTSPHKLCAVQVRNFKSGLELFQRIGAIAEEEGHHPDLHLESWNKVQVVLSTHSIGALAAAACLI